MASIATQETRGEALPHPGEAADTDEYITVAGPGADSILYAVPTQTPTEGKTSASASMSTLLSRWPPLDIDFGVLSLRWPVPC